MPASSASAIFSVSSAMRHRLAVEVAVREHLAPVGEHQRVVGGRVDLDRDHAGGVGGGVAHRAVHLRRAAQRVGVLDAAAPAVRLDDLASRPAAGRDCAADAICPGCGRRAWISGENGVREPRTASTDSAAARSAVFTSRSPRRSRSAPMRGHELGAVDQRKPLLGVQRDRSQPRHAQGIGAGHHLAADAPPAPRRPAAGQGGRAAPGRRWRPASRATAPPGGRRPPASPAAARPSPGGRRTPRWQARWPAAASQHARPRAGTARRRRTAWLRSRFSCRRPTSSREMATSTKRPNPVLTP